ncbi:aspartate--ammonia ligase [Anaerotignum neopropionicum]|uniref:Aspartate--ammonia ligase n=1 Tax=Anaerotignum neopropionicum TaxID=36847 RepID=A0A136WBA1_9FIRM|nr:aspartate--ammonia ligase [Anaerotignum neopropionicum]KXL51778.1 aspartate--ammonia ligase [Anaerotignum neopropionicum]
MGKTFIPESYQSALTLYETQNAIGLIHNTFEENLSQNLNLKRVSAPLFVDPATGLNDNLNGIERPVSFEVPATGVTAEVVHSLAKWKRMALYRYDFRPGKGIYTNMNAIRRDEVLDNLHSIYVDQWDWEKVITPEKRNLQELKYTVQGIVISICDTLDVIKKKYPRIATEICREVTFITSQELEDKYPDLTAKERENAFVKEHKTVFIMQIGDALKSGKPHDGRAPDYDDWKLNGDILFYNPVLDCAFEISSMGIRVDAVAMDQQLRKAGCDDRRTLPFHKMLLEGTLPCTIGGGIGQSRLCMLLLGKAHIGEVQSSIWDQETIDSCKKAGIPLL